MIFTLLFLIKISTFVPMFRRKETKKLFATLITALYIFVALFSQNFHDHAANSVLESKDTFVAKKNHTQLQADPSNCLSCHFLYTGNSFIPQEFSFEFSNVEINDVEFDLFEQSFIKISTQVLFLRGPPANNI